MRQANPRNIGQSDRASDEVALWPELVGDERYRWYASSGDLYSVTHGAGGATSSMAICAHDGVATGDDLVEHLV